MKTLSLSEIKKKAEQQNLKLQKAKDWLQIVRQLQPKRFIKSQVKK